MTYEYFASLYDRLMKEAPYEKWMDFFAKGISRFLPETKDVLDLACGTGEVSVRLYERGFTVTGVDVSEEMLAIAHNKAESKGFTIPFFQQDMRNLESIGPFDVVISFCDSLNYLQTEEDVYKTFQSVFDVLQPNGLFLFDVHSVGKIREFIGNTFADNDDEISYIWNSFPGEASNSVEHELTFFVYDHHTGLYERYDELHKQRTFTIEQYVQWLEETGFVVREVSGDFADQMVTEQTERIFFTAQKPK
ncbi:class I SAM-dependent DNA methyltransferase [Fervidibacillus halotolerans]|uniref:Methyltransferase domain-containing protein n=1 Tax=Fervidibacillus halotolerans TaxID=2980027 RepID=A0A9E8RXU5_9BACI|nr:class I SAM-dependent methyltransferase [Fervidibacillus halotolerans]WAA11523.1 methyltransferase domain-containing protein [Fervidibacillus halotolerans]